jgi:hypothetical protein
VTQNNPIGVVNGAVQRRHPFARKTGDLADPSYEALLILRTCVAI